MTTASEKMINVCDQINCPFAVRKNSSFGCQKYLVALHCHLLQAPDGSRRTELKDSSTQYYLYSYPNKIDLSVLQEENDQFLARPDIVEDLAIEAEFGRKEGELV